MPVEVIKCPACGKLNVSEYEKWNWICLDCRAKFAYTKPTEVKETIQTTKTFHSYDDKLIFTCGYCHGDFNIMQFGRMHCRRCGQPLCRICYERNNFCISCIDYLERKRKEDEDKDRRNRTVEKVIGILGFVAFMLALIGYWKIATLGFILALIGYWMFRIM